MGKCTDYIVKINLSGVTKERRYIKIPNNTRYSDVYYLQTIIY